MVNPARGGSYTADGLPYGLGPRVPMTIVSPWSKGGFVCSQVFDHTSVIRFIETRFGVYEPNITAWRRAVCGDLTTAFDFRTPDSTVPPLPDTSNYKSIADNQCATQPKPTVPATPGAIDPQESGIRFARALPYELHVNGHADARSKHFDARISPTPATRARISMCTRRIARMARGAIPSKRASRSTRRFDLTTTNGVYAFEVFGPNGFVRKFAGNAQRHAQVAAA